MVVLRCFLGYGGGARQVTTPLPRHTGIQQSQSFTISTTGTTPADTPPFFNRCGQAGKVIVTIVALSVWHTKIGHVLSAMAVRSQLLRCGVRGGKCLGEEGFGPGGVGQ